MQVYVYIYRDNFIIVANQCSTFSKISTQVAIFNPVNYWWVVYLNQRSTFQLLH